MSMTIDERFTCIGWEDDSKIAQITTCNKPLQRKLTEYCKKYPKSFKKVNEIIFDDETEPDILEFDIDKKLITIRQPKESKPMTEEEKKKVGERLQQGLQKTRKPREKKVKSEDK